MVVLKCHSFCVLSASRLDTDMNYKALQNLQIEDHHCETLNENSETTIEIKISGSGNRVRLAAVVCLGHARV